MADDDRGTHPYMDTPGFDALAGDHLASLRRAAQQARADRDLNTAVELERIIEERYESAADVRADKEPDKVPYALTLRVTRGYSGEVRREARRRGVPEGARLAVTWREEEWVYEYRWEWESVAGVWPGNPPHPV